MYEPNADPGEVMALYESYYREHPFVKDQHTQYYKRWLLGFSKEIVPDPVNDERYLDQYNSQKQQRMPASWAPVGPIDWDHSAAGRSYCPGSAHVYTVEQSASDPDVLYAGTANAGIWKSSDHGLNWTACTNGFLSGSVTSLEIDPVNPNIVFAELLSSVYKTVNGGTSWSPTGDGSFQNLELSVRDIRCHPDEPNRVFAATNAGLYRSTNSGATWTNIFAGEILEIEFHPVRPDTIYMVRKDGMVTKFYRSLNGGNSFTQFTSGWPAPNVGNGEHQERTEIAVSPNAPDKVYALATGSANGGSGLYGVYVSNNLGANWTFKCCGPGPGGPPGVDNPNLMGWSDQGLDDGGQYYYDLAFAVSPFDKDSIWVCGVNLWVSGNEGTTFTCPSAWSHSYKPNFVHADIHDLTYYEHTGELWLAGDGGIFYSNDRGANFHRRNVGILGTDFWGFGQGHWFGDVMLGGAYHNGTMLKEEDVYINGWICTDGGDGVGGYVNPGYDRQVYSWFNMKDLKSNRTIDPVTRDYYNQPNSTYITGASSDILFHPHYYGTWYTGSGDKLLRTKDNGYSFEEIHDFGADVASMDLCVSDPDVIYACTFPGWWDIKRIYRTDNAGQSWIEVTPPESILNHPNDDWVPYDIVVSPDNPMEVFIARTSMYNGYPGMNGYTVYKSVNGGASWTNISGTNLNGEYPTNMIYQRGTNDGIYIGTRRAVYYRNGSMPDWTLYNNALPARIHSAKMATWYREGKLRNATDRSVWETPFYESSPPVAIPSVQKQYLFCRRDTAYFTDLSALNENGATWQWNFPGGVPSSSTIRNPKVVYPNPGVFDVSLTIQDVNGTDSKTIPGMITVDNRCFPDTTPGGALSQSDHPDYVKVNDLNLTGTNFTITAWVKPDGIQNEYTGIVMNDGNAAGFNFRQNNMLAYHWPGGAWWWDSGLIVPSGQWSYVAMVVQPGSVILYVNGISATHNTGVQSVTLDDIRIGSYQGWDGRNFRGQMDEVCIWNRSLSQDEIRLQRHLTKDPGTDPTIKSYFQFDKDISSGFVINKAAGKDGILNAGAHIIESNAPVGSGTSEIKNITAGGLATFNNGGDVDIQFGSLHPNGKVVVSHLRVEPDTVPAGLVPQGGYYIINNYGANQVFDEIGNMNFKKCGSISNEMADQFNFSLYKRSSNDVGPVWEEVSADSYDAVAGLLGTVDGVNVSHLNSFSQFLLMRNEVEEGFADVVITTPAESNPSVPGGESISLLLFSNDQGLKLPVLSGSELQMLGTPVAGQMAFLSNSASLIFYNGSQWLELKGQSILQTDIAEPNQDTVSVSLPGNGGGGSALLNLNNGLLKLPSFSSSQILTIDHPAAGMLVYDNTINKPRYFNGYQWQSFSTQSTTLPVSLNSPTNITGMAVNQHTKHAISVLEFNAADGKAFQLPVVNHEMIFEPAEGLICFHPALKTLMMFDGERWNKIY